MGTHGSSMVEPKETGRWSREPAER